MDTGDYRDAVTKILALHSAHSATQLARFAADARSGEHRIDGIAIDVFVDQDGEGPFDVWARFEGPDAFALDRRFDDDRLLFGVVWDEDGWCPAVPDRPVAWTREQLEDAVVESVREWILPLLPEDVPADFWWIGAAGCA